MQPTRPAGAREGATERETPETLSELLADVREAGRGRQRATVGDILHVLGARSFGPLPAGAQIAPR